jgi:hypothetical protein
MDIWSADKIALFIFFVIPGLTSIKIYGLLFPGTDKSTSDVIIDAVAYSCLNLVLCSLLSVCFGLPQFPMFLSTAVVLAASYLFLVPLATALAWRAIRYQPWMLRYLPHPGHAAWDEAFAKRGPSWIKVFLKDGTVLAGLYSTKSFATSAPCPPQIYLEQSWILNDARGFDRVKKRTNGILIVSDEIAYLEFISHDK